MGENKFNFEQLLQNGRNFNMAMSVQQAADKIFQKTKKEMTEVLKMPGGKEILKKVSDKLKEEDIHISFSDKVLCTDCGKLIQGDEDNFYHGKGYYCLKCGIKNTLLLSGISDNERG